MDFWCLRTILVSFDCLSQERWRCFLVLIRNGLLGIYFPMLVVYWVFQCLIIIGLHTLLSSSIILDQSLIIAFPRLPHWKAIPWKQLWVMRVNPEPMSCWHPCIWQSGEENLMLRMLFLVSNWKYDFTKVLEMPHLKFCWWNRKQALSQVEGHL